MAGKRFNQASNKACGCGLRAMTTGIGFLLLLMLLQQRLHTSQLQMLHSPNGAITNNNNGPNPLIAGSAALGADWRKYYSPDKTSFPQKAWTLKEMELCKPDRYDSGWPKCANDTSCFSCIYERGREMAANVTAAFHNEALFKFRRDFILNAFGKQEEDPLEQLGKRKIVNLMIVDMGFVHFVINWACGVMKIPTLANMAKDTLYIAMDEESYKKFQKLGFHVLSGQHHYGLFTDEKHPWRVRWFRQSAKAIMTAVMHELMDMHYHVIFNDADMVWLRDPRDWIFHGEPHINMDFATMMAPYPSWFDAMGPSNTGFVVLRNSVKTKIFMESLFNCIPLFFYADDQKVWNVFNRHLYWKQLHYQILPRPLFLDISGLQHMTADTFIVHAVGQGKEKLLADKGFWYYTDQCPLHNILPYEDKYRNV